MNLPSALPPDQSGFLRPRGLQRLFDTVEDAGGEIRVNGGAVRNALLGEEVGDVDLSTTLRPEHVVECLQRNDIKVVPTGLEHGTVTAIVDGKAYEITTLREDIETDGRHAVVRFGSDWLADASRRDFTMNALYCGRDGELFDPLGGYDDLVARKVRFIGDPETRIREDRLRILRFFRFFAWYGRDRPDQEALKACVRMRDGLADLSAERVWRELKRLLAAPGPHRALLWMRTSNILSIVLPESDKWGIDLIPDLVSFEKTNGEQPDALLRLAAIIPPMRERVESLSQRLRLSRAETDRLTAWSVLSRNQGSQARKPPGEDELAELIYRHGREPVLDELRLSGARNKQPNSYSGALRFARNWPLPEFPVSGADLMEKGLKPGPNFGRVLNELEEVWIDSGFSLDRQALLAMMDKRGGLG